MTKKNQKKINLKEDPNVLKLITFIAEGHSHKVFGYLNEEDLKQEIWCICLQALDDFNQDRGKLEHFLRVTVRNRLTNRFKEITRSVRSPCPRCPYYDKDEGENHCALYGLEKHMCKKWHNYQLSVVSRNSLLNAVENVVEPRSEDDVFNQLAGGELVEIITSLIDQKYVKDFDDFIGGNKLSHQKFYQLIEHIKKVLLDNGYELGT